MKKIKLFIIIFLVISCNQSSNCEVFLRMNRDSHCLMIVKKSQLLTSATLGFEGTNPLTNEECNCNENNRWWYLYRNEINIGDTIIKRKGELTFNIHKKDTIISHEWECDDKIYNTDGTVKEVLKKQ